MGKTEFTPEEALKQIFILVKDGLKDEDPDYEGAFQDIVTWCRKGTLAIDS